jgi:hypothetical protein
VLVCENPASNACRAMSSPTTAVASAPFDAKSRLLRARTREGGCNPRERRIGVHRRRTDGDTERLHRLTLFRLEPDSFSLVHILS